VYEEYLKLSPKEFDQSKDGWRKIGEVEGGEREGAELIEFYIENKEEEIREHDKNADVPLLSIMHFHIGQSRAFINEHNVAKNWFSKSYITNNDSWNYYVDATLAFLDKDREILKSSITKTEEYLKGKEGAPNKLWLMRNFLIALDKGLSYKDAYSLPKEA